MAASLIADPDTLVPSDDDARLAEQSSRQLAGVRDSARKSLSLRVESDRGELLIPIPESLFRVILDTLLNIAKGNAVALVPLHAELTTQEAADLLNVSRPFLIQLLESRQLPHRMVGTHRRVLFRDLMDYKRRIDADRLATLEELTRLDQELGLGD